MNVVVVVVVVVDGSIVDVNVLPKPLANEWERRLPGAVHVHDCAVDDHDHVHDHVHDPLVTDGRGRGAFTDAIR
ncbi:hypothetical protein WMF39_03450 [Sorangium sp. So ce1504]|uniref:hypothetical protein n=1 Tax=Sorangium sp. So ce1504 TaxID=3133337 RepID=UPI003F5EDEDC